MGPRGDLIKVHLEQHSPALQELHVEVSFGNVGIEKDEAVLDDKGPFWSAMRNCRQMAVFDVLIIRHSRYGSVIVPEAFNPTDEDYSNLAVSWPLIREMSYVIKSTDSRPTRPSLQPRASILSLFAWIRHCPEVTCVNIGLDLRESFKTDEGEFPFPARGLMIVLVHSWFPSEESERKNLFGLLDRMNRGKAMCTFNPPINNGAR